MAIVFLQSNLGILRYLKQRRILDDGRKNDFINVCSVCLDNDELVNEFCRLKGLKRPDKRSPIEIQIDNACGYDAGMDFMRQLTDFVREYIYTVVGSKDWAREFMGKYLDQCCNDAWDVIRGRKKIIGNKIVNIEVAEEIKNKNKEVCGWLAPDGTFYPVEFGNHQIWASEYLLRLYRDGEISYVQARREDNGDLLTDMGWILIHNPHGYDFKITRNLSKRVTNKQKDYLRSIGKIDLLEGDYV